MSKQITIYSKPQNKFNIKGRYYNVYLNKNSNLDLSSLTIKLSDTESNKTIPTNQNNIEGSILQTPIVKPNKQILTSKPSTVLPLSEEYRKILELEVIENQILESQRKDFGEFISKFQNQDKEISKIHSEKQKLLQQMQTNRRSVK